MPKQDVAKEYNRAVQSLQQLNNELFYDDLKNRMNEASHRYEDSFEKTADALEKMNMTTQRLPGTLGEEMKRVTDEFLLNSADAIENTTKKVEEIFHNRELVLKNMTAHFEKLLQNYVKLQAMSKTQAEEQLTTFKDYVEQEQQQWAEHRQELAEAIEASMSEQSKETIKLFQTEIASLEAKINNYEASLEKLLTEVRTNNEQMKRIEEAAAKQFITTTETVVSELEKRTDMQTKKLQTLETGLIERLSQTEQAQQEVSLSLQEVAVTQAASQQQLVETQFSSLIEKLEQARETNDRKQRVTFKFIV